MPTPSTRTPVRIARGSYSNLNGSVSDLQDGEISYAEDQNQLYIKEGASLVALTYTPGSPTFTGTITGVNLTLSGNLTVSGTQTIINTNVLQVEDKHIEIGKVSSPSDTTADGGGIILKASSDRTFLWVNATDAWTSSEHIHLATGKNIIVTSGKFGVGTTSPTGTLSIASGTFQTTTPTSTGDDIVISGNQSLGIQFLTLASNTSNNNIFFGDTDDPDIGRLHYAHADNSMRFRTNGTEALVISSSQNASFAGAISDSKGDVRKIIKNTKASAYVAVTSDAGKCIFISSGGVTINNNVFSSSDAVTIVNNSTSNQTITQGSGVTMHNAADASSGNRVLAGRGMATIWFHEAAECYISGAGLS